MKKVTQKQVRDWMVQLAKSQGFYGSLLRGWDSALPLARKEYKNKKIRKIFLTDCK